MSFEEPKFEKQFEEEEERREGEGKLENFIGEIAENLKREGVPVTEDCRIDIEQFKGVYPEQEIEQDAKKTSELRGKYREEEIEKKELMRSGEELELLKTAIFNKFLGEDFIVVRTSPYDDYLNRVDNLMLERETGNFVCAFDEVGEIKGDKFIEKMMETFTRNKEGGAKVKYGLGIETDKKGEKKLSLTQAEKIPIFYLALKDTLIGEGLRELKPSLQEKSDYENKLWKYFISFLDPQTKHLIKSEKQLDPILKERILYFEKTMQRFKK